MNRKRTAYKNNGSRRSPRHAFLFRIGDRGPSKVWATVKPARSEVTITLTEDDVQRAAERKGFGDGANCAGAICMYRHKDYFPHAVTGHFDFLERRAYVADRNNAIDMPASCVAYSHNDPVAKLFDSRAGLQKLLARIRKSGPMVIRLSPPVYRQREAGRAKGDAGAPPRRKTGAQGHKLRMTRVTAGWAKELAA